MASLRATVPELGETIESHRLAEANMAKDLAEALGAASRRLVTRRSGASERVIVPADMPTGVVAAVLLNLQVVRHLRAHFTIVPVATEDLAGALAIDVRIPAR